MENEATHQIPPSDGVEDADDWSKNVDDAAPDEHLAASEVESADPTPPPSEGGVAVEPTSTWAQQAAFYIYVSFAAIFSHLILDRVEKKASIWPLVVVGAANCALLILVQFLADQTSIWACTVAGVANCALAPLICIFLHLIAHRVSLICNFLHLIAHHVIQWLTSRLNNALFVAIERVRIELLLLLFASTLLYNENYITQVCISAKAVSLILTRRENEIMDYGSSCPNGKVPLVSVDGLHHICVFIYFLTFFHATYSFLIIVHGRANMGPSLKKHILKDIIDQNRTEEPSLKKHILKDIILKDIIDQNRTEEPSLKKHILKDIIDIIDQNRTEEPSLKKHILKDIIDQNRKN